MENLGKTVEAFVTVSVTGHAIVRLENVPVDVVLDGQLLPVTNASN